MNNIYKTCFGGPFHGKTFAPHPGETTLRIAVWSEGKYAGDSLYRVEEDHLNYIGFDKTNNWPKK
jgi:hypothetical protein